MSNHANRISPRLLALAALAALPLLAGCRDERTDEPPHQFLPDMDDSPKFKPQTETEFFADGRAMRQKVNGAVALGDTATGKTPLATGANQIDWRPDMSRARYLRSSPELWEGIDPNGKPLAEGEPAYVKFVPGAALDEFRSRESDHGHVYASDSDAMKAMILRGQERFNIYCSVCHGFKGEGSDPVNGTGGVVGRRWKTPVPNYHDPKYSDRSVKTGMDGYVFNVIRNGVPETDPTKPPKMPSYADKVSEIDAWAVVLYVRTLQEAWHEPQGSATPAPAPASKGGQQ